MERSCDSKSMSIVFTLLNRGFSMDQITRTMKQLVGHDWREVPVSTWFKRFQDEGLVKHVSEETIIDDLEALISGKIKLDELGRNFGEREEDDM